MANEVTLSTDSIVEIECPVHQALHGYSEGHRLLESSVQLPDDLSRLMLRLSDLSGSNVTSGFEDYLTGYPLGTSGMYALAKTWHAPEVPRPGCVWTHTIILSKAHLFSPSLLPFLALFRRPKHREASGVYTHPISSSDMEKAAEYQSPTSKTADSVAQLLAVFYGKSVRPILVPAKSSQEFENSIFSLWAQQWPALRSELTFSTGSLGARRHGNKPFDIQCVPLNLVRDVQLEMQSSPGAEPFVFNSASSDAPAWACSASNDAILSCGGRLRKFIWMAADDASTRSDFLGFVQIFAAVERKEGIDSVLTLVADYFPAPIQAVTLKRLLFDEQIGLPFLERLDEKLILATLGASEHFSALDAASLRLRQRGGALSTNYGAAHWLIAQLFRAPLNPLSGEILVGLITALDPQTAREITMEQSHFLSTLLAVKPSLAASSQLWIAASDRKRELLATLARQENLTPEIIVGVIHALLESRSDNYIQKAFEIWGVVAVYASLGWIDKNPEAMTEVCRGALTFYINDVLDWIEKDKGKSTATIVALAKVVAPYSYQFCNRSAQVWQRAFDDDLIVLSDYDRLYMAALLLALGLSNAPSQPLALIEKSFGQVYRAAMDDRMNDSIWQILDPLVDHLPWPNDWDKCERLSRGLVLSFVRHHWPAKELRRCIADSDILARVLNSARKLAGGGALTENFFP